MPEVIVNSSPVGFNSAYALAQKAANRNKVQAIIQKGANGTNGQSGYSGADGSSGWNGSNGAHGTGNSGGDGSHGQDGRHGSNGYDGTNGANARSISIALAGVPNNLIVTQDEPPLGAMTVNLDASPEGVLFLNARGGNGGHGGSGGSGGRGGNGGSGGSGGSGYEGRNGANGGRGGRGGNGGNGGDGGDAGHGGDGGDAGDGGHIVVRTTDPRLLMLVEVNCLAGSPGHAGHGGHGGSPGHGGSAGSGGSGGHATNGGNSNIKAGQTGPSGSSGSSGRSGRPGKDGRFGKNGKEGRNGAVTFQVYNEMSQLVEQSNFRYNAAVLNYRVIDQLDDGIYEPGEELYITNLTVTNNGQMMLPVGCQVEVPGTTTVESCHETFILDVLPAGHHFVVPQMYKLKIRDMPSPTTPGPLRKACSLATRVSLLNRSFEESTIPFAFNATYPVEITYKHSTDKITKGDKTTSYVRVKNMSTKPYGEKGLGSLELVYLFHAMVKPDFECTENADGSYQVRIPIPEMQPGQELEFQVPYTMSQKAEFYESYPWTVNLLLRGKMVQFESKGTICCPAFIPNMVTDVMMVLHKGATREEFLNWMYLFYNLPLTINFWDTEYNQGFVLSKDFKVPWVGTCNLIVFPALNGELDFLLSTDQLVAHLRKNEDLSAASTTPVDHNSIIVYTKQPALTIRNYFKYHSEGNKHVATDFGGFHIISPTLSSVKAKIEQIRHDKVAPDYYSWLDCKIKIQRPFPALNFSYGQLSIIQSVVKRDTRLLNFLDDNGMFTQFMKQNPGRDRRQMTIPDMMVAISIIQSLSLQKKLFILTTPGYLQFGVNFSARPAGSSSTAPAVTVRLNMAEAAGYAIAHDLMRELNAVVMSGCSLILKQALAAAESSSQPPAIRSTAENTMANLILIAAIKTTQKKFKSSLALSFTAKKNKTKHTSEKTTRMQQFCTEALKMLKANSLSGQDGAKVAELIKNYETLSTAKLCNIFAPMN